MAVTSPGSGTAEMCRIRLSPLVTREKLADETNPDGLKLVGWKFTLPMVKLPAPDVAIRCPFAALTGVRAKHSTKRSANGHRASRILQTRMSGH